MSSAAYNGMRGGGRRQGSVRNTSQLIKRLRSWKHFASLWRRIIWEAPAWGGARPGSTSSVSMKDSAQDLLLIDFPTTFSHLHFHKLRILNGRQNICINVCTLGVGGFVSVSIRENCNPWRWKQVVRRRKKTTMADGSSFPECSAVGFLRIFAKSTQYIWMEIHSLARLPPSFLWLRLPLAAPFEHAQLIA